MKKTGFTLAEVLITIGIIGVVAAITIPTLIQNHKKTEVVSKLRKISSILQQTKNRWIYDYSLENYCLAESLTANDPDALLEIIDKYFKPYIKFIKIEKGEKGVFGYLPDGSVLYFRKAAEHATCAWGNFNIYVCMSEKACKNINENSTSTLLASEVDGKNVFKMKPEGVSKTVREMGNTRDEIIEACKNRTFADACLHMIYDAGWQIPNDYPIRF